MKSSADITRGWLLKEDIAASAESIKRVRDFVNGKLPEDIIKGNQQ